jgi:preprotein translocase subunit SecB
MTWLPSIARAVLSLCWLIEPAATPNLEVTMSEQAGNEPRFSLQRVYLKDLSLEMPHAPQVFLESETPELDVQVGVGAQMLAESVFEVTVTATVTAKIAEKVVYLVEAKQAGIFELAGLPPEQMDQILGIMCPGIIYPYLRANVADVITRASFPALHLQEVNFQAFYAQRLEQIAAEQAGNGAAADSGLILPPGVRH